MGLTVKQEKFCHLYIEIGNASEAYRQSYTVKATTSAKSVNEIASKLLANVKIASRVAELREESAKRHSLTVDDLIKELEEARIAALTAQTVQASAATGATMGKAKLLGFDKALGDADNPVHHVVDVTVSFVGKRKP